MSSINARQIGQTDTPSPIILPLANSQYPLWLDQQAYPDSAHLNIGGTSIVEGPLDIELMERSLTLLANSTESLRLFPLPNGTQKLQPYCAGPLIDYRDLSEHSDPQQMADDLIKQTMRVPFPLDGSTRPWQVYVWRLAEHRHCLWINFHHLVLDGFGSALLFERWGQLYNAAANPQAVDQMIGLRYQDYIEEGTEYLKSNAYANDAKYWQNLMPSIPPAILAKISNDNQQQLSPGHHHYSLLPQDQFAALEQFASANNVTSYHLFVAALAIYLCRTARRHEIVLGVPILNRRGKRFKATLGMFSIVIPLRIALTPKMKLSQLLANIASQLRQSYRHVRYPLNHLMKNLNLLDSGRDSLFDVYLSFEPYSYDVHFGSAQLLQSRQLFAANARYPLLVNICEFSALAPVELAIEASANYFTETQTQRLSERLLNLLAQMIAAPDCDVERLPLMNEAERYDLLIAKHANVPCHPDPQPFINTFEQLAAHQPNAVALSWLEGSLDYDSFNRQANKLAHKLQSSGCKPQDKIPVIAPRLPATIIAFFAIAKIGAAYLPIDPDANPEQIKQLLTHCTAGVILTTEAQCHLTLPSDSRVITIDGKASPLHDCNLPEHNLDIAIDPQWLAVVLFTSGSTGNPKGVMMAHSGLTRRMAWLARTFNFGPSDIALQSIQLTFDPSLIEILLPLTHGGSVALPPPGKLAPTEVAYYAEHFAATYLSIVPTIMRYVCQTAAAHPNLKLRAVGCGGEVLHRSLALDFVNKTGAKVYNFWGLTETTIFATAYLFDPKHSVDPIAVGEPIDDTEIYILDDNLELLPSGTTGEIYIGGDALSLGYLNEPHLTAQRFIQSPFDPTKRLFKSGDLGYWDANGQLQFVSRIDNMVKVRGQRVEPAQIEAALCQLEFVAAAAVKLVEQELHAWLEPSQASSSALPRPDNQQLVDNVRLQLAKKLPAYMVPSGFTVLDLLPRQVGGKLNYKALKPAPQMYPRGDKHTQPTTDLHRLLLKLWKNVLEDQSLTMDSDFFKAGGNSLLALTLLNDIHTQLDHRLPLTALLNNPTINGIAQAIIERHQPLMVRLSKNQSTPAMYLAASGHGDALRLQPLASALEGKLNLHMLQPPLPEDQMHYDSIDELAQLYAALIEQQGHQTPPLLAGFSIGGITALETARKLIARGIPISGLVLIDSTYPAWLLRRTPSWRFSSWLVNKLGLQELSINQRTLGSLFGDSGLSGQINALANYHPQPLAYPITLIVSSGLSRWHRLFMQPWHKLFKDNLQEKQLPGFHGTLFNSEHVSELAKAIEQVHDQLT